jgi:hypothetical protein
MSRDAEPASATTPPEALPFKLERTVPVRAMGASVKDSDDRSDRVVPLLKASLT